MKYLFLDIDGVLNHEMWYKDEVVKSKDTYEHWWESCFDPECVARLINILAQTGARLVVSSSWRHDPCLKEYFAKYGIPTDFDITPTIRREDENGMSVWVDRGEEVELFLSTHPCDNYVILDDDLDFSEEQLNHHFVHCCVDLIQAFKEAHPGETGLTDRKMREAIRILNG
jgi:hypothetical protein